MRGLIGSLEHWTVERRALARLARLHKFDVGQCRGTNIAGPDGFRRQSRLARGSVDEAGVETPPAQDHREG